MCIFLMMFGQEAEFDNIPILRTIVMVVFQAAFLVEMQFLMQCQRTCIVRQYPRRYFVCAQSTKRIIKRGTA